MSRSALALAPLDGDVYPDLVIGNSALLGGQTLLYRNDGTGRFTDVTAARLPATFDHTAAIALVDLDGDGDLDAALATHGFWNRVYLNLHRQLSAPVFAALSGSLVLQFHARPGYGTSPHTGIALLGLGVAPAPIPVPPLGTFFLNPSPTVALPPVPIPQSTGSAVLRIPIPASPALVGITLASQALIFDQANPSDAHLTGYTVDVIGR